MREIKYKMRIKATNEEYIVGRICIQCKKVYPWDNLGTYYSFTAVDLFEKVGTDKTGNDIYDQL